MFHDPRFDAALDSGFSDAVERVGIGRGRFSSEESVFGCKIAEVFRDGLHGGKWVFESLQRARKRAIRDRQDLVRVAHLNS